MIEVIAAHRRIAILACAIATQIGCSSQVLDTRRTFVVQVEKKSPPCAIEGQPVPCKQIVEVLTKKFKANGSDSVKVCGSTDANYLDVGEALKAVQRSGIVRVEFCKPGERPPT